MVIQEIILNKFYYVKNKIYYVKNNNISKKIYHLILEVMSNLRKAGLNAVKSVGIGTAKVIESSGKIIGISGNIAVTGTETIKVGANTIKVGAEVIQQGAELIKKGFETAKDVAAAVKNKAANITKVGLNTSQKALGIASASTGTIAAILYSLESKANRWKSQTINKTELEEKSLEQTKSERLNASVKQKKNQLNLNSIKTLTKKSKNIQKEKSNQMKIFEKDIKIIEKILISTLISLQGCKEIICYYSLEKSFSKCKYLSKKFNIKSYHQKINDYIILYNNYFESLINQLHLKLFQYIDNPNIFQGSYDEIKVKIINESYEISIFLTGIKQSIINLFSNFSISNRKKLNNEEEKELKEIYDYLQIDIDNRSLVKKPIKRRILNNINLKNINLKNINSEKSHTNSQLLINEVHNLLNNSQNNSQGISKILQQNNSKVTNKILEKINLNNLSNNLSNELIKSLTVEEIQNLSSNNKQKQNKVITKLIKNEKTRAILLKNKTIRAKLSNEKNPN